jgi:hypothetical protein
VVEDRDSRSAARRSTSADPTPRLNDMLGHVARTAFETLHRSYPPTCRPKRRTRIGFARTLGEGGTESVAAHQQTSHTRDAHGPSPKGCPNVNSFKPLRPQHQCRASGQVTCTVTSASDASRTTGEFSVWPIPGITPYGRPTGRLSIPCAVSTPRPVTHHTERRIGRFT